MSSFSTLHYIVMAKIFESYHIEKGEKYRNVDATKLSLVKGISKMFKEDNPKFNEMRFVDACYGGDEDV